MKKLIARAVMCIMLIMSIAVHSFEFPNLTDEALEQEELAAVKEELEKAEPSGIVKTALEQFKKLQNESLSKFLTLGKNFTYDYFKRLIRDKNPAMNQSAVVMQDSKLSYWEQVFRSKRMGIVRPALQKFLGQNISKIDDDDLYIGFVGTGGGYRAMILTAGYLAALQDIGLYDALYYISTLSGSTWTLAPLMDSGLSPQDYKMSLLNKIKNKKFDILQVEKSLAGNAENIKTFVDSIVWPKFIFGQPIRSIDLYGFLLSQVLFGSDGPKKHLSDAVDRVKAGTIPLPIYTAASVSKKSAGNYSYDWYEFNPLEVRAALDPKDPSNYYYIPSYSFASQFNTGKSIEIAPEQPMGYLLGIFGSAYSINFKDIGRFIAGGIDKLKPGFFSMDQAKYFIAAAVVNIIKELEFGKMRFSPAQIFNPFKGYANAPSWIQNKDYLTLVDGGIEYNIPARPLLWPSRKLKVLIIGESSANVESAEELKKFFSDAKTTYGYNYIRIDNGSNDTIRLYKDLENPKAPRIIYINFLKDEKLMALAQKNNALNLFIKQSKLDTFDPNACVAGGFCDTFNFNYTPEQFLQLVGMAELNIKMNAKVIKEFLWDEIIGKLEDTNFPVDFGG